jgi:hypothetical protein
MIAISVSVIYLMIVVEVVAMSMACVYAFLHGREKRTRIESELNLINLRTKSTLVRNAVVALLIASHASNGIKFIKDTELRRLIGNLRQRTLEMRDEINRSRQSGD